MRLVLAGGGSAGHINPMLAVAQQAKQQGFSITMIAGKTDIDQNLINNKEYDVVFIKKVPFPRIPHKKDILSLSDLLLVINFFKKTLIFPIAFLLETRKCRKILQSKKANAVLGFGGFIASPVYLASIFLKIPIYIHEANVCVGLANKAASFFAKRFFTAFPAVVNLNTKNNKSKFQFVGLPLRKEFLAVGKTKNSLTKNSLTKNNLNKNKLTKNNLNKKVNLLVFGGSQGAKSINQTIIKALPNLLKICNITHITGPGKKQKLSKTNAENFSYTQLEYSNNMAELLEKTDFTIARAGAGTVLEIASLAVPACFVPLPFGNGEQSLNADYLVQKKAAIVCADKLFSVEFIENIIIPLLKNPKKMQLMRANAKKAIKTNASEIIVKTILNDIKNV
ncbi:MAG: UDP-N-acetylglucosamine--N-acetylmuramyl-(pentapeptide) pyrophosphoryl-undecaprenol N-acetylglucosamine transferase [Bifidobacteriaceae bacterium]|jgi:UDP-N-acetylglucosamine--N-acetylmuramyl-(pentapeptide) pyrophosphoryl-undecaprenol N-acetylglucosamine transferase|nr:UDP-N-acetylglucosamine--N-acetylmuramyl-(pentapeptide) pyrophosphoryl-undecaprenol N-acetylglucosamine transferase [Bifidobacteriaceae bacterium]